MLLITGAAGQNGRAAVMECVRRGLAVRALVRNARKAEDLAELPGVELVEADLLRPDTLAPALDGVERALLISSADPTMLDAQCTFIDAAVTAGVRRIVKFSGRESGIGFDPSAFRYTREHVQIERHLQAAPVAWTHLQPSQFMQVYLREARAIAARGVLALPAGEIRLSPVDVPDLAKLAFHLLTADGEAHTGRGYPVTGPQALSMREIAAEISRATGRHVEYRAITPEQRREDLLAAGTPAAFADDLYDQAVERLKHPNSHVSLEAYEEFGVRPTTFAQFAARHASDFS